MHKLTSVQSVASKNVQIQVAELDEIKGSVRKEAEVILTLDEAIKKINGDIIDAKRKQSNTTITDSQTGTGISG